MASTVTGEVIEPSHFVSYLEKESSREVEIPDDVPSELSLKAYMMLKETEYFRKVIAESGTHIEAAKRAGLTRSTFYHRLKMLGIKSND